MNDIHDRLATLRERRRLSLRQFADLVVERGRYDVSHDSARRYEDGTTRIPARYLAAVCRAFGISAEWMLLGREPAVPPPPPLVEAAFQEIADIITRVRRLESSRGAGSILDIVREDWDRFTAGLAPEHGLREAILESWARSREAGVDPTAQELRFRKVSARELEERTQAEHALIDSGRHHLRWLSTVLCDTPHVVYLVCREGIVLHSVASDPELIATLRLEPGYDWSEEAMGTNGAGTALATGNVVAVLGPEHYVDSVQGCTCLAAPIRGSDGSVRGAIDLSTSFAGWRPDRLALVAYTAEMIERDLLQMDA